MRELAENFHTFDLARHEVKVVVAEEPAERTAVAHAEDLNAAREAVGRDHQFVALEGDAEPGVREGIVAFHIAVVDGGADDAAVLILKAGVGEQRFVEVFDIVEIQDNLPSESATSTGTRRSKVNSLVSMSKSAKYTVPRTGFAESLTSQSLISLRMSKQRMTGA